MSKRGRPRKLDPDKVYSPEEYRKMYSRDRYKNNRESIKQAQLSKYHNNPEYKSSSRKAAILSRDRAFSKRDEYLKSIGYLTCCVCGYSKCARAIDYHHITKKQSSNHGIGYLRNRVAKWDKFIEEISKTIPLCSNCHREFHDKYGVSGFPEANIEFVKNWKTNGL